MNQLPVNKIIFASFAFVLMNWRKIVEISILPLLLSLPLLTLSAEIIDFLNIFTEKSAVKTEDIQLPSGIVAYALLSLYGHISLSINMYRLVIFGADSVSWMPIFKLRQIVGFLGLTFFINLVTGLPLLFADLMWIHLAVSFFLVPISLNFINIATDQSLKFKWEISVITQVNLFFLQILLPLLSAMAINFLIFSTGLPDIISWIVKVIVFYWTLINLALCYQLITQSNTSK